MTHTKDVYNVISDGKWHTTMEIADGLGLNRKGVYEILYRAERRGIVNSKIELGPGQQNVRFWKIHPRGCFRCGSPNAPNIIEMYDPFGKRRDIHLLCDGCQEIVRAAVLRAIQEAWR